MGRLCQAVPIDPLRLSFEVSCRAEHAFATWTTRMSQWWPPDHTLSDGAVVLEPGVGGRIFERSPEGEELDWGRVTVWEPPGRLSYRWHLGATADQATEVEVTFEEGPDGTTRVEIEHRGWDAVVNAVERRTRNQAGWAGIIPPFSAACEHAA